MGGWGGGGWRVGAGGWGWEVRKVRKTWGGVGWDSLLPIPG